jgi:glycerol uptake facilitator-like aquaporin
VYAFMVFGGLVLVGAGLARGVNAARIGLTPAVRTAASVVAREQQGSHLTVYYSFQPTGAAASSAGIADVSAEQYATAEPGSPIQIEYLASDPDTNWLAGHSPVPGDVFACFFGLVLGAFVLVVAQWRFRPRGIREAWRASRFP